MGSWSGCSPQFSALLNRQTGNTVSQRPSFLIFTWLYLVARHYVIKVPQLPQMLPPNLDKIFQYHTLHFEGIILIVCISDFDIWNSLKCIEFNKPPSYYRLNEILATSIYSRHLKILMQAFFFPFIFLEN